MPAAASGERGILPSPRDPPGAGSAVDCLLMTPSLRLAIEQCLSGSDRRAVAHAARALSEAYRGAPDHPVVRLDEPARLAYLATRFPATLAALAFVAREAARRVDLSEAASLLELGAGPGPARWAMAEVMPGLRALHQVDRDEGLLALGRQLATRDEGAPAVDLRQEVADLARHGPLPPADVVVVSYAIGELRVGDRAALVQRAWDATRLALVLVEPGTVPGASRVLEARSQLVAAGGHVVAPCPHDAPCPMGLPDWCHVPVRLERSRLHQQLKGASLGFEDEKLAYVAVTRAPQASRARMRVVAHPEVHSGHVTLSLCTVSGLGSRTFSKREGEAYRRARRAAWGDALDA